MSAQSLYNDINGKHLVYMHLTSTIHLHRYAQADINSTFIQTSTVCEISLRLNASLRSPQSPPSSGAQPRVSETCKKAYTPQKYVSIIRLAFQLE